MYLIKLIYNLFYLSLLFLSLKFDNNKNVFLMDEYINIKKVFLYNNDDEIIIIGYEFFLDILSFLKLN